MIAFRCEYGSWKQSIILNADVCECVFPNTLLKHYIHLFSLAQILRKPNACHFQANQLSCHSSSTFISLFILIDGQVSVLVSEWITNDKFQANFSKPRHMEKMEKQCSMFDGKLFHFIFIVNSYQNPWESNEF